MYIAKAIIFNSTDLPIKHYELKSNDCPKCKKHSYQNYCGECGTKIEPSIIIMEDKIRICDFMIEHKLFTYLDYQISGVGDDDRIFIYHKINGYNHDDDRNVITLSEITKVIDYEDFENNEEVKKVLSIFKEHNISFTIDIVVIY